MGVERIFPLYSPHIDKIEVNKIGVVRRARIYYCLLYTSDKSAAMHDVKIRFTTNLRSERFDTDVEVILYRVICELINR